MLDFVAAGEVAQILLENSPVGVAVFDRHMRYLAHNRQWLCDNRLEDQDLVGKFHYDVFPQTPESWRAVHRRVMAGERLSSSSEQVTQPDGTSEWVEWWMVPWRDRSGEVGGAVHFARLTTDLVEGRQQAQLVNTELDLLINSAREYAITMADRDGCITVWSAGSERLYGWTASEVIGQPVSIAYLPEDNLSEVLQRIREQGPQHYRAWRRRKDGTLLLADITASPVYGDNGALTGFAAVTRDVTYQTAQAQMIDAANALLRSIVDTVPDAMITIDGKGIVASFSGTAEQMFGYDKAEVLGRNVAMLMPEPYASRHDANIERYLRTGERHVINQPRRALGRRKDGTVFPLYLHIGEAVADGKQIFTGFLRDLTDQERADARLHEMQAELIHMSRVSAVGTMAAALAHELNQPLTAIANYVQTAEALLGSATQNADLLREALDEAGRQAIRAGAIVRRLRDFVARGDLERTVVSPRALAQEGRELGAAGAATRRLHCPVQVPADLPSVLVDRVQIQQVLLNLIRNGFEAMDGQGDVTIDAWRDGGMIHFAVADEGPGIRRGEEEKLFEPFSSTKTDGMGIGLAICRTIIEAHGGRMWAENRPQGGAVFHFTLPIAPYEDDAP